MFVGAAKVLSIVLLVFGFVEMLSQYTFMKERVTVVFGAVTLLVLFVSSTLGEQAVRLWSSLPDDSQQQPKGVIPPVVGLLVCGGWVVYRYFGERQITPQHRK